MKIRLYFTAAIFALLWTGCNQEEATSEIFSGSKTINATIEGTTRSTVTDAGVFSWAEGDAISLLDGNNNNDVYNYSGSGNGFTLTGESNVTEATVAYYPASELHTTTQFYLPEFYGSSNTEYIANTHAAMIATPPTEGNTYAFMHLGGVMRFNIKNVPAGADGFQFTAESKNITGPFTIVDGDVKTLETSDGYNSSVYIWFKPSEEARNMTFYVPMPIGTYGNYTVSLRIGGDFISHESTGVSNTIDRKTLLLMPTFTYDETQGLVKGTAKIGVIDLEDGDESAEISESADIVVTPGDADATATLNYTPADNGSSVLSLSDGSGATESGESKGKVVVETVTGSTVASCEINTPALTVELTAPESGAVTFNEVTALTAQQTLIIGEGVTIKKLVVKGGNVVLKGNVETIESEVATTITLDNDIESDKIITISGPIILDGIGKTLTSTAGRAINVSGANGVTIQNLEIVARGERAINIIQNATNVTIDHVTATAKNYTVNVASSAPNAKVAIKNSTLNGLCVVNVSGEGADVTVDGSIINCLDKNSTAGEVYAGLSLNMESIGGKIIATNTTINVEAGSDSHKGRNSAEKGLVTIDGSTEDVVVMVAAIKNGDSSYYYTIASLAKAVEFAKNGNVIKLIRNIELSESITIPAGKNIVLDLNGKTISQEVAQTTAYAMITNKGTLTVMDSSSEKTGKISYADVTVYSKDNNYASNTIKNEGVLNLKSGTIENVSNDNVMNFGYPHAIDAYQGSITNIEGGTVKSANYDCIRMFCNSTTLATTVNISGGKIINRVSFQNPSSNAAGYGVLNITGGEFTTTDNVNANVRLLNFSTDITKMSAKISGGTFDKGVKTQNYSSTSIALTDWLTIENVNITEIK